MESKEELQLIQFLPIQLRIKKKNLCENVEKIGENKELWSGF